MTKELTYQEEIVLILMNEGKYLVKTPDCEAISTRCYFTDQIVKEGTAKRLLEAGLIRKSEFTTTKGSEKYMLTDEGRKYRSFKYHK